MTIYTGSIPISTRGDNDTHDITAAVQKELAASGYKAGTVTVFVPGSTAGLTTIEFESGVVQDLGDMLERTAPSDMHYKHNERWNDGNGYSHVRAALVGPSLTIPFTNGELLLGTWQQIVLVDFDNRPRDRKIIVQIMGA